MAGIIGFDYLPLYIGAVALVLTTLMIIFLRVMKMSATTLGIPFVVSLFFLLGLQTMDREFNTPLKQQFDLQYVEGDIYTAEVLSIANSKKLWNRALVKVDGITDEFWRKPVHENVLMFVEKGVDDIAVGDKLFCNVLFQSIENKNNPGEFDSENYWRAKGIKKIGFLYSGSYRVFGNSQSFLTRWFSSLDRKLSQIFEDKLQPEAVGIAKALVLGDRDHLDTEAVRSFGNSGAMHVLAVSGLHVGMILVMLIFIFSKFPRWISKNQATILAIGIIWFYAFLTGLSPSVLRAVIMFSMLSLAKLSGRNYNSLNVLGASALVILLYDRLLVFDLGFQLSYLAMVGIFLIYPMLKNLFYSRYKLIGWVWEGTSVALAEQLFTLPLTLFCFHQFPNYFLLSNLGVMVISNFILVAGVVFIGLYKIPFVNVFIAWCVSVSVLARFYFVRWIDFLPGSVAKGFVLTPFEVLIFYAIILLFFFAFQLHWKHRTLIAGSSALLLCAVLVYQRFVQNSADEFVVYNDSRLIFSIKKKNKIYCFYENEDYIGKAVYTAESYEKTRSGEIEYVKLDNEKELSLQGKGLDFRCQYHERYYEIDLNGKRIHLTRRWSPVEEKMPKDIEIYLPYVMVTNEKAHKLAKGAFVYPI